MVGFGKRWLAALAETRFSADRVKLAGIPTGVTVACLGRLRLTLFTVDRAMAGWIR